MKKCLIFGAAGRVGSHLASYLSKLGDDVIACTRKECNLENRDDIKELFLSVQPTHVINCAAISGLETCLDDPVLAHRVNAMAPEMMAQVCHLKGIRFIHLSTDYVLDGRRAGLKEESAKCKPISVYGESKFEAELRIMDVMPEALVARVSWVFGNWARPAFPEMILKKAIQGEPLAAIADKWSMPTWVGDLSEWLRILAFEKEYEGVLHLCQSGEPISWHSYAQLVVKNAYEMGLISSIPEILEQKLDEQSFFRDARPRHTAMSSNKLALILDKPIRHYEEALGLAISGFTATMPQTHE